MFDIIYYKFLFHRNELRAHEIESIRQAELTGKPLVAKKTIKILKESGRYDENDGMTVIITLNSINKIQ